MNSSRTERSMGRCMYWSSWGEVDHCRETFSETCSHSWGWTPAAAGLTCVNEGVFLHIRFLVEPLPAVLARIGPGVWVDEQVGGQSRRSLKTLATNLTIKAAFLQREEPKCTHVTPHQHPTSNKLLSSPSVFPFLPQQALTLFQRAGLACGDANTGMISPHDKKDNAPSSSAAHCSSQKFNWTAFPAGTNGQVGAALTNWAESTGTFQQGPKTWSLLWEAKQQQHCAEATSPLCTEKWVLRSAWPSWEISVAGWLLLAGNN